MVMGTGSMALPRCAADLWGVGDGRKRRGGPSSLLHGRKARPGRARSPAPSYVFPMARPRVSFGLPRPPPVVLTAIITLVAVYILSGVLVQATSFGPRLFDALAVTSTDVLQGEVWRLVTYALVHSLTDPLHL